MLVESKSTSRSDQFHMTSRLLQPGFLALVSSQFFGAANDNVLKQILTFMVATGLWSGAMGRGGQTYVALCLTLPFILLSGYAGQIADRWSKRTVIVWVKIAELPIACLAMIGLWTQNLALTLAAMLLLAIQSAFFGPAKYGVIPELVDEGDLSRANGMINMLTNIAIILGSLAAGPLSGRYFPTPDDRGVTAEPILWLPGAVLVTLAAFGLVAALRLPKLSTRDPQLKFDLNPFGTYRQSIIEMAAGPLLKVALAWSLFYLIGMMALLILPEYQAVLNLSFEKTSLIIGGMGVAIGAGSALAGYISGHHIETRLIPLGAIGMTTFFLLLGFVPPTYVNVMVFVAGAGVFAGFYIIPLQALLQLLSPQGERGRFLGTANAMSFIFSTVGSLIFLFFFKGLAIPANRMFLVCGALALLGISVLLWQLRELLQDEGMSAEEMREH